ncbi:E3 ubiquitin-protein ligase Hakai isoform X2 [Malaya genurostris]|uniref:E3 ubiquitin-protein ligase Hakai isoform X2 n=1 Tax=Malaya genurostris TaxID=325434 RepID=UPI0026F4018A|nr:E3 ubiquitin-protein ligase Hakai isoform X2 [Malaya genurostris]
MKFSICFTLLMSLVLVTAQSFGRPLTAFDLSSLTGDFGGPSAFADADFSSNRLTAVSGRDPRQNRGPVVFPPPPTDGPMESSGVIVGASGYGFVPPSTPQKNRKKYPYHRYPPATYQWKPILQHYLGPPKKPPPAHHGGLKKPLRHPPYKLSKPVALVKPTSKLPRPKRTQGHLIASFTVPGFRPG